MNKGINEQAKLTPKLYQDAIDSAPIRSGFGDGLLEAGRRNGNVVGLCADLTESTKMDHFANEFPERFFEVGVAEQNLVTVASGLAAMGKIPFVSSYAAFSPGRNWEQIRTTICLNQANVKIAGSHAGISVGPDGATHQMLEDIALMRVLPNMKVIVPCDAIEARKATLEIARQKGPAYIRLARADSQIITTDKSPFNLGKSWVLRHGEDVTIIACGTLVYQALIAAEILSKKGISAEVINCAIIKPIDKLGILSSVRKTKRVATVEEHQIAGGLGSAVTELLAESLPVPVIRIGINDEFGESGTPQELAKKFGLTAPQIAFTVDQFMKGKEHKS